MPVARTQYVNNFRGINERLVLGTSLTETTSLDNVIVRDGVVRGRFGISKFDSISTAERDTPIIGHAAFYRATTQTTSLLRFSPTKVKVWNATTHVWDDITGTALNGVAATRPQSVNGGENDFLAFTNEGKDRPRKYTGTGNTAVLGGTPPYAKSIGYWKGFLALGNTSAAGTTFLPLNLVLSDDPDNVWEVCSTADGTVVTLVLNESPGEILAMDVQGEALLVYKSDAIIEIRLSGNATRFSRYKLDFPLGIMAPLSLQSIPNFGHIFLASDRNLYVTQGRRVTPLPPKVQKSLREVMTVAKAPFCRSSIDVDKEEYHLYYQRVGSSFMDGEIIFNYRTGEFSRELYPVEFNAAQGFRASATTAWRLVASTSTLTYEIGLGTDDDGTTVSRFYDFDWSKLGMPGDGWLTGVELVFTRNRDLRVRVSVGLDKSSKFLYSKVFTLQGGDPDEVDVKVQWHPPSPLFGSWFRFRVEMYHDSSTNVVELKEFNPEFIPVTQASETLDKPMNALSA